MKHILYVFISVLVSPLICSAEESANLNKVSECINKMETHINYAKKMKVSAGSKVEETKNQDPAKIKQAEEMLRRKFSAFVMLEHENLLFSSDYSETSWDNKTYSPREFDYLQERICTCKETGLAKDSIENGLKGLERLGILIQNEDGEKIKFSPSLIKCGNDPAV